MKKIYVEPQVEVNEFLLEENIAFGGETLGSVEPDPDWD